MIIIELNYRNYGDVVHILHTYILKNKEMSKDIIKLVPQECSFTCVLDCCHSGGNFSYMACTM